MTRLFILAILFSLSIILSVMSLLLELSTLSSPCMIIIRGIPGSGKSTLAQRYLQLIPDAVHCEADHYFINRQGEYCYDGSKVKFAHQYCQKNIRNALSKGQSVIVSNTTIKRWELTALLDIATRYNIEPHIIHCCGAFTSNHNVPAEIVANMALNYEVYPGESRYIPS
ncbi:AAA family ATPase [Moritella sp. 28]|uniref:AAA family ATPase n=2 Tax=unclassified Moritella TaxID=2637987 RepID=UPI0021085A13|nr:AAA family ATPase [Moritella sp. 28]